MEKLIIETPVENIVIEFNKAARNFDITRATPAGALTSAKLPPLALVLAAKKEFADAVAEAFNALKQIKAQEGDDEEHKFTDSLFKFLPLPYSPTRAIGIKVFRVGSSDRVGFVVLGREGRNDRFHLSKTDRFNISEEAWTLLITRGASFAKAIIDKYGLSDGVHELKRKRGRPAKRAYGGCGAASVRTEHFEDGAAGSAAACVDEKVGRGAQAWYHAEQDGAEQAPEGAGHCVEAA